MLYYGFAVIQPKSRRRSFRRSEVNQRAVVIEVAISRANVTHERDLGKNLPFLCAQSGLILLCISHHAALWSTRSFVPLSFLSFALSSSRSALSSGPMFSFSILFFSRSARLPSILPSPLRSFPTPALRLSSLSIYFSLFGAVDRVTSNVNQSAGIVASFLRQWFSIFASERCMEPVLSS